MLVCLREQSRGADAVPALEGVGLELALLVREVDLEDGVSGRDDERVGGVDRLFELQPPALDELLDDPRQALEPLGPARLLTPPGER